MIGTFIGSVLVSYYQTMANTQCLMGWPFSAFTNVVSSFWELGVDTKVHMAWANAYGHRSEVCHWMALLNLLCNNNNPSHDRVQPVSIPSRYTSPRPCC